MLAILRKPMCIYLFKGVFRMHSRGRNMHSQIDASLLTFVSTFLAAPQHVLTPK
jgi:hypothetical protein